jgi:hypothetical protein
MAEAPASAPEAAATEAVPSSPTGPITSLAELEPRLAEIKARHAAGVSVQDTPESAPAPQQNAAPSQPADPAQGDVPDAEDSPTEQAKPGGRFARLREQLTQAEDRARQYEQHVQQREAEYQGALRQFVDLVLPDATLEQLRVQAEGGDWEAKQRVDQARAWRRMVAPIANMAHQAARQEFDQALAELRTLDGMDADSHQKLLKAETPGEKLKLMHGLAYKAATAEHKERIAALEAEVQSLKTNRAANGSQPASGGGRANGTSGALAGMFGPDGYPTEEAIAAAKRGDYRGLFTH